jgi:hypothetical protein
MDTSWLSGEPCSPPCWYGLRVGYTEQEEALMLITQIPSLSYDDVDEFQSQYWDPVEDKVKASEIISIPCKDPKDKICSQLEFVDGILSRIVLFPNFPITFSTAVNRIGEPKYITARPIYPEIGNCEVRLVWLNRNMMISYFETQESSDRNLCRQIFSSEYRIPPTLPISSVVIEDQKILDLIPVDGEDFPWVGFLK